MFGEMAVDIFHNDHGAVDDDPEIDSPDREQVGRSPLQKNRRYGKEKRERNHRRHDAGAGHITEKHKQHDHHQPHPHDEIVENIVGGDMHQIDPLVEHGDLHPLGENVGRFDLGKLAFHGAGSGKRFLPLAHQHDPLDDVVFLAAAHDAHAGLMPHHHAGELAHIDWRVVGGFHHHVGDVFQLVGFDRDRLFDMERIERVDAPAKQAHGANVMRLSAEREKIAADVGVGLFDRILHLLHRHAVAPQFARIDEHLILLDGAAKAGHIDHSRHLFEEPVENPVLHRLELVDGVARAFKHIAHDLAGGAPGGEFWFDPIRQANGGEPVEHLLPGGAIIGSVGEAAFDVVEAGDRGAAQRHEAWHAVERRLQWNPDQPFHLFGARAGMLADHLHQRRRGIGVGLDIEL